MTKKLIGLFTTIVAALAVVGVAWASGDDSTSTSITATSSTSATVDDSTSDSVDDSPTSTGATTVDSSPTSTTAGTSTSTSVDDNGGDRDDDDSSTTSTSIATSTSTSIDDDEGSTTSTSIDDNDRVVVPDGITTHNIPGVGAVSIEVSDGQLFLVTVSAPGWSVEHDHIEKDRIELEFTKGDAEAEFEARIRDSRVEVRVEVDSD